MRKLFFIDSVVATAAKTQIRPAFDRRHRHQPSDLEGQTCRIF